MLGEGCVWRNGQDYTLPGPAGLPPLQGTFYCLLRTVSSLFSLLFSTSSPCFVSHPHSLSITNFLFHILTQGQIIPCQHLFSRTGIGTLVQNRCLLSLLNKCRASASPYSAVALLAKGTPPPLPSRAHLASFPC